MKKVFRFLLVVGLLIFSNICMFTGNEKGIIFPFGLIEMGLISELLNGKIDFDELILLLSIFTIQVPLLFLFSLKKRFYDIVFPLIFIVGYLILNFYDFNFKDWEQSVIYLIPFIVEWIILIKKT